jgi:hypothetical protein
VHALVRERTYAIRVANALSAWVLCSVRKDCDSCGYSEALVDIVTANPLIGINVDADLIGALPWIKWCQPLCM